MIVFSSMSFIAARVGNLIDDITVRQLLNYVFKIKGTFSVAHSNEFNWMIRAKINFVNARLDVIFSSSAEIKNLNPNFY